MSLCVLLVPPRGKCEAASNMCFAFKYEKGMYCPIRGWSKTKCTLGLPNSKKKAFKDSTRAWDRVDNKPVERRSAATEVSTGREEERLTKRTVLFNAWLILCHEAVQINQPNRRHQIPIHSIYVLTPTLASWWSPSLPRRPRGLPRPEVAAQWTSTGPTTTCEVSVSSRGYATSLLTSCRVQEDGGERRRKPTTTSRRRSSTIKYGTGGHVWTLRKFKQLRNLSFNISKSSWERWWETKEINYYNPMAQLNKGVRDLPPCVESP
jgi:hypothetical protein